MKTKFTKTYILDHSRPIAQQRPRSGLHGFYNPQKLDQTMTILHLEKQHENAQTLVGPLHVELIFFMEPSQRILRAKPKPIYYSQVPDIDNLIKFYLDALNYSCVLENDRLISSLFAKKIYAYDCVPHTEITITEL